MIIQVECLMGPNINDIFSLAASINIISNAVGQLLYVVNVPSYNAYISSLSIGSNKCSEAVIDRQQQDDIGKQAKLGYYNTD